MGSSASESMSASESSDMAMGGGRPAGLLINKLIKKERLLVFN